MRAVAPSAAPPDQAPHSAAEAAFAEAKAYLSSREAQQMSESDLERVLHRLGQELMRKLLQGHLDQRSPGEAAGLVEGTDDVERSQRRVHERHLETTFGTVQVARLGGSRSSMAPRRSSTSWNRAPPPTASTSRWYWTSSTWPSRSGRRRMCSIARGAPSWRAGPGRTRHASTTSNSAGTCRRNILPSSRQRRRSASRLLEEQGSPIPEVHLAEDTRCDFGNSLRELRPGVHRSRERIPRGGGTDPALVTATAIPGPHRACPSPGGVGCAVS